MECIFLDQMDQLEELTFRDDESCFWHNISKVQYGLYFRIILMRGKIYQIEYAVFYLILRVIGFEYVGMKLLLYCIATKFAIRCKFCYKRLFRILVNLIVREYNYGLNFLKYYNESVFTRV